MPGFPSVDVFNYLLSPTLVQIKEPALECLQDVYLYLENLAEDIANKVFARNFRSSSESIVRRKRQSKGNR